MESRINTDLVLKILASSAKSKLKDGVVTFLVGLVGSDGVLLASDKQHTRQDDYRSNFQADKIFVSDDRQLAYCASGAEIADEVGKDLLCTLKTDGATDEFKTRLENRVREKIQKEPLSVRENMGTVLLSRMNGKTPELWWLSVSNQHSFYGSSSSLNWLHRVSNRICEGDKANAACFIGEAYFPKNHNEIPISRLRLLAAHSVLMAGKVNPHFIGGLNMAESTKDGFRKLSPDELEDLEKLSVKLDKQMRDALLGVKQ